ncbi:12563_t:CDS:2, partial [Gigaspora rosea]
FEGKQPYLVINHLGRSKIDVNRPIKEGVEGKATLAPWNDYYNFIRTTINDVETNFGHGLLIDIHENFIEIGYVLSAETLLLSTFQINKNPEIYSRSSIHALYTRNSNRIQFANLLYGKTTLLSGRLQSHDYDTVPSHIHKHPVKDEKYFHGGYC